MRGKVLFCSIFNAMNSTKKFFPYPKIQIYKDTIDVFWCYLKALMTKKNIY